MGQIKTGQRHKELPEIHLPCPKGCSNYVYPIGTKNGEFYYKCGGDRGCGREFTAYEVTHGK